MDPEYKRLKDQIDADYKKKLDALEVIFGAAPERRARHRNGGDVGWKVEKDMTDILNSQKDAVSLSAIRKQLESAGVKRNDVYLALRRLVGRGEVSITRPDKKRGGARYWLTEKQK